MTLVWQPGYAGLDDPDAAAYITNVEAADLAAGQSGGLEDEVKLAIHNFVKGCKNDGIWPAIKASCILAGAKTLAGALVPLVKQPADSAPARFGTEGGWNYNRETGLKANGTDNYINSGRNNNADPQNSQHLCLLASEAVIDASRYIGSGSNSGSSTIGLASSIYLGFRSRNSTNFATTALMQNGFLGINRANGTEVSSRIGSITRVHSQTSNTPSNELIEVFRGASAPTSSRFSFYSIGESLPDGPTKTGLQLLDERVSALITAFQAPGVIP